jgi:anti-anti-sigma regulatory factor
MLLMQPRDLETTMTTATLEATGNVESMHLADGMLVRLTGAVATDQVAGMRLALLMPLPDSCRDVVVDAGDVTDLCDEALAVLLAARTWAEDHGARFLVSRSAPAVDDALEALDLADALPRLSMLAVSPDAPVIPLPRPNTD